MTATLAELISALPGESEGAELRGPIPESEHSLTPTPLGRFRRLTTLGSLQAKIAAAYLFHWLRGWFTNADEQKRRLAETHWQSAVRMLDSMTYLRGAVMKVGQTLANFPNIAPREVVETLGRLHFAAPPMHWSLLREMVHAELGDEPEKVFATFDRQAFAAASLGQVHRATLPSGQELAVKIQYPGIARTIGADFRNMFLFLLPARLTKEWESTKDQFDDLRQRLEQETDYEREADSLRKARKLFHDEDGIVVPEVYPQFSTGKVLTMERLEGVHLSEFVASNPSQADRNEIAKKLVRGWYRLMYAGRMLYVDFHPGNYLVFPDGRLGLIDFGSVWRMNEADWDFHRRLDRPMTTGKREDRLPLLQEWGEISADETERLQIADKYAEWCWMSRMAGGEYDFSDDAEFRTGIDLFTLCTRKRYTRGRPASPTICRSQFGWRAVLYLLKAQVDVRSIAEEEIRATGWDRSAYT